MMHEGIYEKSADTRMAHKRERFMVVRYWRDGTSNRAIEFLTTSLAVVSFKDGILKVSGGGCADLIERDVRSVHVELDPRSAASC